jgi:hypothetical protein
MDVNNFLQSEATQFVGTAAANTIGLVIGTIHEDIKELLEIPMNIRPSVLYLPEPELSHRRLRLMTQ